MAQEDFDKAIQVLWNAYKDLNKENEKLKELCDKYEEEHNTTFKEWQKDIQANKKAIEYIKVGKTFDNKNVRKTVDKIQNDLLEILEVKNEYNK